MSGSYSRLRALGSVAAVVAALALTMHQGNTVNQSVSNPALIDVWATPVGLVALALLLVGVAGVSHTVVTA